MHQLRDENGQWISIGTLFERERKDHQEDHKSEHTVAAETARKLEQKVDEAARRLERDIQTALTAVAETARIHADAHAREHSNHERIHAVESDQVKEARDVVNERLDRMNEFRGALEDQANKAVNRELFDATILPLQEFRNKAGGYAVLIAVASTIVGAAVATFISQAFGG
jgi:hypothetical protein